MSTSTPQGQSNTAATAAGKQEGGNVVAPTKKNVKTSGARKIQALPQNVVDQIAAGEVVQRPVSVIKELVENSLDAESTSILVHYDIGSGKSNTKGISNKLQVIDNGCGIQRTDLGLAATRFATSKLSSVDDFDSLSSFGFRGEALASMSLVARLEIASRVPTTTTAFVQTYRNGKPTLAKPRPQARTPGTTVTVSDLFYNLPHRQSSLHANSSDEYHRVLQICQRYAIHYPQVSFVCRRVLKGGKMSVDLNTGMLTAVKDLQQQTQEEGVKLQKSSAGNGDTDDTGSANAIATIVKNDDLVKKQEAATKQVMGNVFGSGMESRLYRIVVAAKNNKKDTNDSDQKQPEKHFELTGLVSDPSFHEGSRRQTQLVLFCNHRSVDSNDLKRRVEALYSEFGGGNNTKPLVYLSIHVPPCEVDVNVHPSKKQVTLLHQDLIYDQIGVQIRAVLEGLGQSFRATGAVTNPYKNKTPMRNRTSTKAATSTPTSESKRKRAAAKDDDEKSASSPISNADSPMKKPKTNTAMTSTTPTIQCKDKIRTTKAAPAGALEPFVVITSPSTKKKMPETEIIHESSCALAKLDLANPGAFAQRCTCTTIVRTARIVPTKVPKISPSICTYKSVLSLRNRINKHCHDDWKRRLRKEAIFVGHISEQRCLVQCGVELQEWHLERLAQLMFQQLVLLQFGGMVVATTGAPVAIAHVVGQLLELEDLLSSSSEQQEDDELIQQLQNGSLSSLEVREAHQNLADQVATCLLDRAEMLDEYFSIGVEKDEKTHNVVITGLPVILPRHQPQPSGLPLFLLRLATEVNWDEEKPCFLSIAKELGLYYGAGCERHQIFPAICQLLVPPKAEVDECFTQITQLASLYKVFERS